VEVVISCILPSQGHVLSLRQTYSNYGDKCFVAAGLKLWNKLPAHLRQTDIYIEQFKQLLKG